MRMRNETIVNVSEKHLTQLDYIWDLFSNSDLLYLDILWYHTCSCSSSWCIIFFVFCPCIKYHPLYSPQGHNSRHSILSYVLPYVHMFFSLFSTGVFFEFRNMVYFSQSDYEAKHRLCLEHYFMASILALFCSHVVATVLKWLSYPHLLC